MIKKGMRITYLNDAEHGNESYQSVRLNLVARPCTKQNRENTFFRNPSRTAKTA